MSPRRKNDQYFTPTSGTLALLDDMYINLHEGSRVYEPCAGQGAIAEPLAKVGCQVYTADIDPEMSSDFIADARREWPLQNDVDWVITNPPFNQAGAIFTHMHRRMAEGKIKYGFALMLRLSFLEPTGARQFLKTHPPCRLLVLPRMSFTGDGKTDSVTCAWMVWTKQLVQQRIRVYTKDDLKLLEQKFKIDRK